MRSYRDGLGIYLGPDGNRCDAALIVPVSCHVDVAVHAPRWAPRVSDYPVRLGCLGSHGWAFDIETDDIIAPVAARRALALALGINIDATSAWSGGRRVRMRSR